MVNVSMKIKKKKQKMKAFTTSISTCLCHNTGFQAELIHTEEAVAGEKERLPVRATMRNGWFRSTISQTLEMKQEGCVGFRCPEDLFLNLETDTEPTST